MYTMGTVLRHGNEEQKREYLPKIATGELRLQAFGVTEPGTGSDTTQLKTRAEKRGEHYVINGQKVWTSRAAHSDLMLLLARTTPADQVSKRTQGISTFLIDLREAVGNGCEIRPIDAMINHNTTEVFFDELKVPASSLIGEEGKGFRYILDGMNAERCLIAAEAIGTGRYFIRRATDYANERVVFKRKIGENQGVQFPIAKAHTHLEAADLMVRKATALFEAGRPCGAEANMAKYLAAEACWEAGEACFDVFGGFAFAREYNIERKWREARLFRTAPVSANMVLNYIGQHVLGLPRSY
jgi:acyl-CoA dehydrogenase